MRVRKVADMDVIAQAGAVRGRIVVAEQGEWRPLACGRVQSQRNEVGFRIAALTDLAVRAGARAVEIAQPSRLEAMRAPEVCEDLLDHQLQPAVGIDRRLRLVLRDRHPRRLAIGGADQ